MRTCESLCETLRGTVGLTNFRIELQRAGRPLVISLRASAPPAGEHWGQLVTPGARLDMALHHDGRLVAYLRIEDQRRARYPDTAHQVCERLAAEYLPELALSLASAHQ
ncbi:MAG: hypothetical protein HYU87_01990 [Chloroflexi bacterium]|nr:hypothetical protein [Chloroflexota bacterium]